jgi:hypothetical protein
MMMLCLQEAHVCSDVLVRHPRLCTASKEGKEKERVLYSALFVRFHNIIIIIIYYLLLLFNVHFIR